MVFLFKTLLKTSLIRPLTCKRVVRSLSSVVKDRAASIASLKDLVAQIRVYDEIDLEAADLDWDYILDKRNFDRINENINNRKTNFDLAALVKSPICLWALFRPL